MPLHRPCEVGEGRRRRFVYACSSCEQILDVNDYPMTPADVARRLEGKCPGCGGTLDGAVGCRLAPTPDGWPHPAAASARREPRSSPSLTTASSLPHFSLGFPPLDRLLVPLGTGQTVVVTGSGSSAVAELAAFRAQLPIERGGLDSTVLFVDGGNRSDPYLFSSFARRHGVNPRAALRRVASCRVFTMYQLADLLSRRLEGAAGDYAARLVVVSDLLGTFNEPELDEREARRLLKAVGEGLTRVKRAAMLLVTLPSQSRFDGQVEGWADTLVRLSRAGRRVRGELLKHPVKAAPPAEFQAAGVLVPERGAWF